jgi:hypothetical protein
MTRICETTSPCPSLADLRFNDRSFVHCSCMKGNIFAVFEDGDLSNLI